MIIDIHTHKLPASPQAVTDISNLIISGEKVDFNEDCLYSAGIHPWNSSALPDEQVWQRIEEFASLSCSAAIGECGIDLPKGGPMFLQLQIFQRQIDISESLHKPLIVHCVKADDIICGLRRDLHPSQPWAIHGFRGKPQAALQLLRSGCYLSFGANFNPDTLRSVPRDRILAETDDADLPIEQVISRLSECVGEDLTETIADNSGNFCNFIG